MSDYDEPVLTTSMWVSAHIRRCLSLGIPAVLVRRGDDRAGIVLIKWNSRQIRICGKAAIHCSVSV